ncbi:MAG: arsenite methyltransferase [Candidatus Omnitrophota bacterium]
MKNKPENIKKAVKKGYGKIAESNASCCSFGSCCSSAGLAQDISKTVGYSEKEMDSVPQGANLGLGCGNPVALASLREGDVVLDLGSGAGFDVFLAAQRVGGRGRVIGVDMTPQMIAKAKENAKKGKYINVEFRLGEIEKLPVDDSSIDVIISNCVINLSPDKKTVFKEAFRVLKPDGKLMISDLVLVKDLPDIIKDSIEAYVGCLAGAIMKDQYLGYINESGFDEVNVMKESSYPVEAMLNDVTVQVIRQNPNIKPEDLKDAEGAVSSVKVSALKRGVK